MVKKLQKKKRVMSKLVSVLIFLLVFNLLSIPLYIALYTNFSFEPLKELNARMASVTLNFFGYKSHSDGSTVNLVVNGVTQKIDISWDSTGWKSMYALAALILATPLTRVTRKIKFIAIGVVIIFLVNYFRITTTILISAKFGFNWFDLIHTVLWREGLILAVVGVWFGWIWIEKYKIRKNQIKFRWLLD
ncbi:MAG: exosortase/archaeosortase family protein [Candidatus Aenigmatarchaeota archaeon]|nr:exosortase/archaeosortase family protein [Candidatus Aenigmarchaeota archaeon]